MIKKSDLLFAAVVIVIGLILFLVFSLTTRSGRKVTVTIDGELFAEYSLDDDGEYMIETARGVNRLIISNHQAYVTDADCPDKLCEKQHAVSMNGESIVCLPHRVIITVSDKSSKNDIDAMVY